MIKVSSEIRTQAGQTVHVIGMLLAAAQLLLGISLAAAWGLQNGSFVLLSACFYAIATYLIGRSIRRLIDRRSRVRNKTSNTATA